MRVSCQLVSRRATNCSRSCGKEDFVPNGHPWLPRPSKEQWSKKDILRDLTVIDTSQESRARVLAMETQFRTGIESAVRNLPATSAPFPRFRTSPFVLVMQALRNSYSLVSQIEKDIIPAKLFSSMETSIGRQLEVVTLPQYGWECVDSEMVSPNSMLDGRWIGGDEVRLATLKSGPNCLNDEMSENFADGIIAHAKAWAREREVDELEFTYGALYGTPRTSNKKDWHILRHLVDKLGAEKFSTLPNRSYSAKFEIDGLRVTADVKVGRQWWAHLGGPYALLEVLTSLTRACTGISAAEIPGDQFELPDLRRIVAGVPDDYNVSLLQGSQLQWIFMLATHFADSLVDD